MEQKPRPITKPKLFIETQFSDDEDYDSYRNLNLHPKDVISEASSYDIIQPIHTHQYIITHNPSTHMESLITGVVQLTHTIDAWQVNALFDAFSLLKVIKPVRVSQRAGAMSKILQHSESVANLNNNVRGENRLMSNIHKRKPTSSSSKDLQRAQVLNEIITKLHSRERSEGGRSLAKSRKSVEQKEIVKEKLKTLESMLKNIKQVNEQSTQKSTVYHTKHYNKSKKTHKQALDSSEVEDSRNQIPSDKMGTFKRLKNDIMQVKSQFNDLKQINEVYRRENYLLKSHNLREQIDNLSSRAVPFRNMDSGNLSSRAVAFKNVSAEAEFRHSPLNQHWQTSKFLQPSQNFVPNYGQNYSYQVMSPQYAPDLRQPNYSRPEAHKCQDARHEGYWRTMVPDGYQVAGETKEMRGVRETKGVDRQPMVFCFKCGCRCGEKGEVMCGKERREFVSSPFQNLKEFL